MYSIDEFNKDMDKSYHRLLFSALYPVDEVNFVLLVVVVQCVKFISHMEKNIIVGNWKCLVIVLHADRDPHWAYNDPYLFISNNST